MPKSSSSEDDPFDGISPWPAYGTLHFDPKGSIRVPVLGPTGNPFGPIDDNAVFLGQSVDGDLVSLLGTFTRVSGRLGGLAEREIDGRLLVVGAHLTELEDFAFDRIRVRFEGLRQFLWPPYGGNALGLAPSSSGEWPSHERVVRIAERDAVLRLELDWEGASGPHSFQTERYGTVEIQLDEPLHFQDWLARWVTPLRDLITFATREPSVIHSVCAVYTEEEPKT